MTGTVEFLAPSRDRTQDYFQFLKALIKSPRQTASIVPSSPYLGRMMAAQIDPVGGPVIELGGGTGALTRQILATGLPADNLEVGGFGRDRCPPRCRFLSGNDQRLAVARHEA